MAFIVLSEYFSHSVPERMQEIVEAINYNVNNPLISEIYLVHEPNQVHHPQIVDSPKIHWIELTERPSYQYFFSLVNERFKPGSIYLIANLDIYYDASLELLQRVNWDMTLGCLSRWNLPGYPINEKGTLLSQPAIQLNFLDSQDTWITGSKINVHLLAVLNYCLGTPGCDGKTSYHFQKAGYRTINPCEQVKSYHNHVCGGIKGHRTISVENRIPRPYGQVAKFHIPT